MGGRGSDGGKSSGGSTIHNEKTQQFKSDTREIKDQMKQYKKTDKIKYINEHGGSDIQDWESYSSKDIDKMFKQVRKGKKMKKLGYTWVVDYQS